MDEQARMSLARSILEALEADVLDSIALLRGSLARGTTDRYSDIDVLWEVQDASFPMAVDRAGAILSGVAPVESLRSDPAFQRSDKRRLFFVRFLDVPLFWRLDLELFAQSIQRDRHYDLENPNARGDDWSLPESALMNGVAAVKAHLRGNDHHARELLDRGYRRIGLQLPEGTLKDQILALTERAAEIDNKTAPLATRIRALVEDYVDIAEDDNE